MILPGALTALSPRTGQVLVWTYPDPDHPPTRAQQEALAAAVGAWAAEQGVDLGPAILTVPQGHGLAMLDEGALRELEMAVQRALRGIAAAGDQRSRR